MQELSTSIIIIGNISCGKSTLAKRIAEEFHIPRASFGGYLLDYCQKKSLFTDRKVLQDLGDEFVTNDSMQFLENVIQFSKDGGSSLIFEGVRHQSIFDGIKKISRTCISIFIDLDQDSRYQMYLGRDKEVDQIKTFEQFVSAENHPVEKEIETLKNKCDLVIGYPLDNYTIVKEFISSFLAR